MTFLFVLIIAGRNRRYIDKNFGGFLIIWDRLFGTFEEEDPEEKPVYGVTTQMDSFNPLYIQVKNSEPTSYSVILTIFLNEDIGVICLYSCPL